MDQNLNIRAKTTKLLEENIRDTFSGPGSWQGVLSYDP